MLSLAASRHAPEVHLRQDARAFRTQQCAHVPTPYDLPFQPDEAGVLKRPLEASPSQCSTREQPPTPSFGVWKWPPEPDRGSPRNKPVCSSLERR